MHRVFQAPVAVITILALNLAQTGCVTAKKYKMAKTDAPPARPVGWTIEAPPAELTLATLIVFKGPGSWKREARWDEYVVRIANRGDQPMRIDEATLIDLLGQPRIPGADPWKLEKLSSSNWDKYGSTGLQLLAGAGLVAVYAGISISVALGSMLGGTATATGGAALALTAIPVFAVVDLTSVAVMNHNNKKKVVAEFSRRRLELPLTIAPATTAEGSLFFPMTPGPQRLTLKGRIGGSPLELVLELKQLAGLHLKPKEAKAKPP
jgi:hypothetical protein